MVVLLLSEAEASRKYVARLPNGGNVTNTPAIGHPDGTGASRATNAFDERPGAWRPMLCVESDCEPRGSLDDWRFPPQQRILDFGPVIVGEYHLQCILKFDGYSEFYRYKYAFQYDRSEHEYPSLDHSQFNHYKCAFKHDRTFDDNTIDNETSYDYKYPEHDHAIGYSCPDLK
ncbi:hypothetical protein BBJ29_009612 [Phytophthora kernoviae]|uniref:Uncharacterized protein n=1 Tax=Phytophthora kernoviae TaxID=325452 RepID=A0A3F2RLH3_9STRA|nr:hypothetical protein BBP00_00006260 [Phytophthora kernoviae]RLN60105.1 hypothetical protein BBJ29_009612 [Phytophthora kernoviae]